MGIVRILEPGDEARLDAFLAAHADSSMFLRSNWRAFGLADRGAPLEGAYAAEIDRDAMITGVAAHYGNGMIALQAPGGGQSARLVRAATRVTARPVRGLVGPRDQVVAARSEIDPENRSTAIDSHEDLFAIDLGRIAMPAELGDGRLVAGPAGQADVPIATAWRVAYSIEAFAAEPGDELERTTHETVTRECERGNVWLLRQAVGEPPVAMAAVNARVPDAVQVGGVYTPPALRGRGYGGAAVAALLCDVRKNAAVERAVLFTGKENVPARHAYQRIGFRRVGDYGIVLFASPLAP